MSAKDKDSQFITLINPPKGKSTADDYAERANQWAEKKMKTTVSALEQKKQNTVVKMSKEQISILKDYEKIRKTRTNLQNSQKKVGSSKFLQQEKAKLHNPADGDNAVDEYRSDGNSSDNFSEISVDDDDSNSSSNEGGPYLRNSKKPQSSKRKTVATYEERSRDQRITNLQRRYSAQVRTNPIVNVNRRLKYEK